MVHTWNTFFSVKQSEWRKLQHVPNTLCLYDTKRHRTFLLTMTRVQFWCVVYWGRRRTSYSDDQHTLKTETSTVSGMNESESVGPTWLWGLQAVRQFSGFSARPFVKVWKDIKIHSEERQEMSLNLIAKESVHLNYQKSSFPHSSLVASSHAYSFRFTCVFLKALINDFWKKLWEDAMFQ